MYQSRASIIFLVMVALTGSPAYSAGPDPLASLQGSLLPVEEAFQLNVDASSKQTLQFHWVIAPHYFLYREQIKILNFKTRATLINPSLFPSGLPRYDAALGDYQVYADQLTLNVPRTSIDPKEGVLLQYQGCSQSGFCYTPVTQQIRITAKNKVIFEPFTGNLHFSNKERELQTLSKTESILQSLKHQPLPWTLVLFFVLGVLLTFTPCVLPMLPIVVNLIVGQHHIKTKRATALAGTFILSMAFTYALAGLFVGLLGQNVQAVLQKPLVLSLFCIFLFLMALQQFGIFHWSFLEKLNPKLQKLTDPKPGTFLSASAMGMTSALMVSPCVTPALVGALAYVGQQGQMTQGGLALFALGLGMGAPLFGIAVVGNSLLPSSGAWMIRVRNFTGLLLLGLIIWILERFLPPSYTLFAWGLLLVLTAIQLGTFKSQIKRSDWVQFWRGVGVLMALYGALLMVGAFSKYNNMADPFSPWVGNSQQQQSQPLASFSAIQSFSELQTLLNQAQSDKKPTLVYFHADWCANCRKIEQWLQTPEIQSHLSGYMKIKVDVTHNRFPERDLMKRLRVYGPPTLLFYTQEGQEAIHQRSVGDIDQDDLIQRLESLQNSNTKG